MLSTTQSVPFAPRARRPFKLTRYFSITSLLGIALVTSALLWTYRSLTERHLVEHEGRANVDQTRAFANAVWERHREFVLASSGRTRDDLMADPAMLPLHADVAIRMRGLQIAKIKIYNTEGLTVYSSAPEQIGEDKSTNQGFKQARAGQAISQITFREKFDAFEGTLNNRNLIASYVPIRGAEDAPVEAVFEVYSDVTELLQQQQRAQWQVAALVLGLLGALYLFLFLVVRKADRIIARQNHERAEREAQIRHQAYHDSLTGLPNRAYFIERLGEALAHAARHGRVGALLFIDLDRFKIVNDSLGHQAGDELLRVAADRIGKCLRASDLLFRMGGDEFTVILPEITGPEDAAIVARRVLEAAASPVSVHEHELTIGATIGIAAFPDDGTDTESLLKNADAAMYSAKDAGRGSYAFYRVEMNQRAMQQLDREAALKRAFRNGEFTLHYQPRLDARTHRVVAAEALLRWASPAHGLVPPGEFIGVLEDTGMMNIVGEWVLRTACVQARTWHDAGPQAVRVSVNVSSTQFQSTGFVGMVERVLRDTGVPPELVELELTESMLIANTEQTLATIGAIKALGLRISIDDFGTGYSSLSYLRLFDVDYLKIDRSFVSNIGANARDRAVATAIVELAQALGIGVVAEGVETSEQAQFFTAIRCGELQGFLFCKPLPAHRLDTFLAVDAPASTAPQGPREQRPPGRKTGFGALIEG